MTFALLNDEFLDHHTKADDEESSDEYDDQQQLDQSVINEACEEYLEALSLPANERLDHLENLIKIDMLQPKKFNAKREENLEGLTQLRYCVWKNYGLLQESVEDKLHWIENVTF